MGHRTASGAELVVMAVKCLDQLVDECHGEHDISVNQADRQTRSGEHHREHSVTSIV